MRYRTWVRRSSRASVLDVSLNARGPYVRRAAKVTMAALSSKQTVRSAVGYAAIPITAPAAGQLVDHVGHHLHLAVDRLLVLLMQRVLALQGRRIADDDTHVLGNEGHGMTIELGVCPLLHGLDDVGDGCPRVIAQVAIERFQLLGQLIGRYRLLLIGQDDLAGGDRGRRPLLAALLPPAV